MGDFYNILLSNACMTDDTAIGDGRYGFLLPAPARQYAVHLPLWQSPPSRKGTRFQVKTAAPVTPARTGPAQTLHSQSPLHPHTPDYASRTSRYRLATPNAILTDLIRIHGGLAQ